MNLGTVAPYSMLSVNNTKKVDYREGGGGVVFGFSTYTSIYVYVCICADVGTQTCTWGHILHPKPIVLFWYILKTSTFQWLT